MRRAPDPPSRRVSPTAATPAVTPEAAAWVRGSEHVVLLDLGGRVLATDAGDGGPVAGDDYLALWTSPGASDRDTSATADLLRHVLASPGSRLAREHHEHDEHEARSEDGRTAAAGTRDRWWRVDARHVVLAALPRVLVVVEDVTDRRGIDDAVRARAALLDHVDAAVIATDLDGIVRVWNRAAEQLYGWSTDEAVGRAANELIVPASEQPAARSVMSALSESGAWEGDFTLVRRDGSRFLARVHDASVQDPDGTVTGHVGVSVDVTETAATTAELARSAAELAAITNSVGDALLTLDDDQRVTFANPAALRLLARPIDAIVGQPLSVWLYEPGPGGHADHRHLDVVTETDAARPAGCWIARPGGQDVAAEYVATPLRDVGGGLMPGWVVVLHDVTERRAQEAEFAEQLEQVRWLKMIRDALDQDGFELHAQPIVSLTSGRVVQHELLLRMRDPDRPGELIAPGRFLPTAEAYGLAPAIDHWVLAQGFALAATGMPVEINLSATTLADAGLANRLERLAAETGADPRLMVIELTETALLADDTTARTFVDRIRDLGFELALDDFGTGYGGFSYLKQLPVDYLKIDIDFVRDALIDPASRHVIGAVVSLASAFGLRTVAEGVEDAATLALLRELGVDLAQGFHIGRPAPLEPAATRREGGTA